MRMIDQILTQLISIHALHEESDQHYDSKTGIHPAISIHALHEESDDVDNPTGDNNQGFQSTLSMRRATP